ncbi:MAG: acyl-CoA dehydrogenase family protein, partial [Deltaproteobacteria bacterium]|nr:acyl-CoA dehydrogenase family protein [Deltaproteobacteria bacterium]
YTSTMKYDVSENSIPELDETIQNFLKKVRKRKYHILSWPRVYGGRECTYMETAILDERTSYYAAPMLDMLGTTIMGPTILKVGTEANKKEWIPKIASGELRLWLAYSEPNSGSDLSSIQTTAVEDGDDYMISGQKIWSSIAHISDYAWLIAKTDPNTRPQKGLSIFMVDNKTPGIELRPLVNALGEHHFNEVFYDHVRVPKKNLIGQKNKGFYYVMTALEFERISLVGIGTFKRVFQALVDYVNSTVRDGMPLASDVTTRRKLSEIAVKLEIGYLMFWRTASMMDKGEVPTVEASSVKLITSELSQQLADVSMDILGPYGLLESGSKWTPLRGLVQRGYLDCIPATIGAGTSEIQRNIIATRGLGLPVHKHEQRP